MDDPEYIRRLDFDEIQYDQIVSTGMAAARAGDREQARTLLHKATEMKPSDDRPWLWLSATTDDLQEQRDYLERAVAANPNNGAAKRGLVLLSEKLDRERLLEQGEGVQPRQTEEPEQAETAQVYACPSCGGHMSFDAESQAMVCEFCGYVSPTQARPAGGEVEETLDFVLPTTRGHRWAEAQHRLACTKCGAESLLPPGQTVNECPYCGSRRLIESQETRELVDPVAIGLARFSETSALRRLREWLGRGWFVPDDLRKLARTSSLRAAYYPFWAFDGTLEMNWTCEVNEGTSRNPHWVRRDGVETQMFDDQLVPAMRALRAEEIARIEPFNTKKLVEFEGEFLSGWTAMTYDLSLADASLKAREKVARLLRRQLYNRVLLGREKRRLRSGTVNWSGMTFKLILLPMWVGTYRYRNHGYRVLINGQSGKVGGLKPRDDLKVAAFTASVAFTAILLLLGLLALAISLGWINPSFLG